MLQEGCQPAGQYDLGDGYTPLGGEVYVLYSEGVDAAGHQLLAGKPVASSSTAGPYFLSDDGLKGYGTLFGVTVARTATGFASGLDDGTRLGPATYVASGKVTLWDKPGLYAVTLDALDPGVSGATWSTHLPGDHLTVMSDGSGRLTAGGSATDPAVTIVTFKVDESLVTTGGSVVDKQKLVIRFNPFGLLT
jgi:hypothetical protein